MTLSPIKILLFFCLLHLSCKRKENNSHPDWKELHLRNGWTIKAPNSFMSKNEQGIDSEPGFIFSKSDSISFQFDSGAEEFANTDNFSAQVKKAEKDITSGFYKDFYKAPILHKAYLDTINGLLAKIVIPTTHGKGITGIVIYDCPNTVWLGITGENLSPKTEALLLEMFKTITLKKE